MSLLLLLTSTATPPTPTPDIGEFVTPTSKSIELALGERFDHILITEDFVKGAWSLSQAQDTICRDLTGNTRDAMYAGTGFTRGIECPLPEGALGCDLDGNGHLLVSDHSDLSLAGGSIDVVALFKTTTMDSVLRAIVQKQVVSGSGDGYHIGLKDGDVRFELNVGGVNVFSFGRGPVSDGLWHVVHGYYDPVSGIARLTIDGVPAGADVSTANTDPTVEVCDLRIGMFNNDTGGFIGTIAKVMVGREGNLNLGADLEASRTWTDVTEDVNIAALQISTRHGIAGSRVQDGTATIGMLSFALNNSESNSAGLIGLYSVGHANCRTGFKVGAAVRYTVNDEVQFRGTIEDAPALPGVNRERTVLVSCATWWNVAATTSAAKLDTQINKTTDEIFGYVIDGARRPPPKIQLNQGIVRFPYAIDSGQGESDVLLSELARVAKSSGGYGYERGDGTVVWEGREVRQSGRAIDYVFNAPTDVQVEYTKQRVINSVWNTGYPRRLDPVTDRVLAAVPADETAQPIGPGQTVVLQAGYKDPEQASTRIGGGNMVSDPGTDYTFNSVSDGSGTDLTSSLIVTTRFLANVVRWTITNPTSQQAFATLLQARGTAIYHDGNFSINEVDIPSINEHDERELKIDMPYEGSNSALREYARLILGVYSSLQAHVPIGVTVIGNRSEELMEQALTRDVGDLIGIEDPVTGVTTTDGWYINEKTLTYGEGDIVTAYFRLAPSWPEALLAYYTGPVSGIHNFSFGGALELPAPGDYTFAFNRLGDTINVRGAAAGGGGAAGIGDSTNSRGGGAGGGGESLDDVGINVLIDVADYTGKVGAGGIGTTRPGGTGGTTEFRKASELILQLIGGTGGACTAGGTVTGGAGGTGGTGTGRTAGSTGGAGSIAGGGGNDGVDGDTGGGGGGGAASGQGGIGGDGEDQSGGARGAAGNSGTDASGKAGTTNGGSAPGGGGGGGGGKDFGNLGFRGGGGGGGSGGTSTNGDGGKGSDGALVLELV